MFNCYTCTLKWEMYLPVWLIAILLFYTQLLLFIHLLSWVKTLILFASGVQMYLSFTMELKTKPPNHNFSTCYLRKNLVFLNNYVMFTIPFVCSSFCSIFFFQSYIHGSSQAQFVAETHIVIVLSILLLFTD